jgi:hypothetical protein
MSPGTEGSFPGMLASRTFEVVLVAKGKPVAFSFGPKTDRTVRYEGAGVAVELKSLSRSLAGTEATSAGERRRSRPSKTLPVRPARRGPP